MKKQKNTAFKKMIARTLTAFLLLVCILPEKIEAQPENPHQMETCEENPFKKNGGET